MKRALLAAAVFLAPIAGPAIAQPMRNPAAIFTAADTDHDGRISFAEFQAARAAQFGRMDRDGDGVITRNDFARIIAFRPQAAAPIDAMIAEADLNHDGKVTREELARAPSALFNRVDTNRDGYVDKAELAAFKASLPAFGGR